MFTALFPQLLATDALWPPLRRLLTAYAPSGGCLLPGAIAEVIHTIVSEWGLAAHWLPEIGHSGNAGLTFGAPIAEVDVLISAHMDRPSFRVRDLLPGDGGALYPICADRFPAPVYRAGAVALRWQPGTRLIGLPGAFTAHKDASGDRYHFRPTDGDLTYADTITLAADPVLAADGTITGTGLDNSLGILAALIAARTFHAHNHALATAGKRLVIAFTDREEGVPRAFFGHGAARLTYALPPPRVGALISDGHGVGGSTCIGGGAVHGFASAWGAGSYVPPHLHRLACDFAAHINGVQPRTVQLHHAYQSRSDDLALNRWACILGMIGAPMLNAHTAQETASLPDLPLTGAWLAAFALAVSGLHSDITAAYALRQLT